MVLRSGGLRGLLSTWSSPGSGPPRIKQKNTAPLHNLSWSGGGKSLISLRLDASVGGRCVRFWVLGVSFGALVPVLGGVGSIFGGAEAGNGRHKDEEWRKARRDMNKIWREVLGPYAYILPTYSMPLYVQDMPLW